MSAVAAAALPARRWLSVRAAAFAAGCIVAVSLFAWLVMPTAKSTASAAPASAFSLQSVNGDSTVSLASRAGKPAVVNFFASWCVPCRRELPRIEAAAKANGNVAFIGVDHQDSRTQAHDLLMASGVTYPSGYDPQGSVAASYGISAGLPATVFIDGTGKITHIVYGEISDTELHTQLSTLVGKQ